MTTFWQHQLNDCNDISKLSERVKINLSNLNIIDDSNFAYKAPLPWINRIHPNTPNDPLLRQILPTADEDITHPAFNDNPVGDLEAYSGNGIIHKYHNRILLIVTEACAIHCRYCFRRHFPYREHNLTQRIDAMLDAVSQDETIEEVILSGGDPMTLANHKLFELCERLETISHIQRIRIHTRMPIVIPERIDTEFIEWSQQRQKPYVMVVHINHPNEVDDAVATAMQQLKHWQLLNQSVLLKGVNDDAEILINLSKRCFEIGVMPYYLHLLDKVAGATHFDVSIQTAKALMQTVSANLSGYLVPKLVYEASGSDAKNIIAY